MLLVNRTPYALYTVDHESCLVSWNLGMQDFFGKALMIMTTGQSRQKKNRWFNLCGQKLC